ncbi:MAG: hypothetical protein AB7F59_02240 [Bdellovibrionales bacterium]
MKTSLKENLERNFRENVIPVVLPIVYQIKGRLTEKLDQRFPKESRDQMVQKAVINFLSANETIENTAKDVAEQSRESEIVQKYVRPFVSSEKTEKALHTLETRVSRARPLVVKLQNLRDQFLASTDVSPVTESPIIIDPTGEETPKRKKSRSKSEAAE